MLGVLEDSQIVGGGASERDAESRVQPVRLRTLLVKVGGPEWNGRLPLSDVGQPGVAVDPHGPTASQCPRGKARRLPRQTGGSEMQANRTVVGVDTAKRVFQLHWVELETGEMVDLRLSRAKFLEHFANRAACLVGMEAWVQLGEHPADVVAKIAFDFKDQRRRAPLGIRRVPAQELARERVHTRRRLAGPDRAENRHAGIEAPLRDRQPFGSRALDGSDRVMNLADDRERADESVKHGAARRC